MLVSVECTLMPMAAIILYESKFVEHQQNQER